MIVRIVPTYKPVLKIVGDEDCAFSYLKQQVGHDRLDRCRIILQLLDLFGIFDKLQGLIDGINKTCNLGVSSALSFYCLIY